LAPANEIEKVIQQRQLEVSSVSYLIVNHFSWPRFIRSQVSSVLLSSVVMTIRNCEQFTWQNFARAPVHTRVCISCVELLNLLEYIYPILRNGC
jgi:hypothetical protein